MAQPIHHCNFDGKNWLEQISEPTLVTQLTANQNFSNDVNVNVTIKGGDWKMLFDSIVLIPIIDSITTIGEHYIVDMIDVS